MRMRHVIFNYIVWFYRLVLLLPETTEALCKNYQLVSKINPHSFDTASEVTYYSIKVH